MTQFQIRIDDAGLHQVYRTELGIDRVDVGQPRKTPREAIEYSDLMAARTSRPRFDDSAVLLGSTPSGDERAETEAPGPQALGTSTCAGCGGPLPPGRHGQRRLTCSTACRRAAARRAATERPRADTDGAGGMSHLPGPSDAVAGGRLSSPDPTSLEGPGGCALPGSSKDAGPVSSRSHGIPVQTLGL